MVAKELVFTVVDSVDIFLASFDEGAIVFTLGLDIVVVL